MNSPSQGERRAPMRATAAIRARAVLGSARLTTGPVLDKSLLGVEPRAWAALAPPLQVGAGPMYPQLRRVEIAEVEPRQDRTGGCARPSPSALERRQRELTAASRSPPSSGAQGRDVSSTRACLGRQAERTPEQMSERVAEQIDEQE